MDLRAQLLALVAPVGIGDELAPGLCLRDASTELGLRLTVVTADGAAVHVEVQPPQPDRRFATRTDRWALSYRRAPGVDDALALHITEAVAERVRANEATVGFARADQPASRIRDVTVDRILEPAEGFDTLSPYVGCLIGCRFCYAQSRLTPLRRLLGPSDAPWGSWVDVRVNAARCLVDELADRPRTRPIKLCPIVSDPYHALEAKRRLTRACLTAIADHAPQTPVLVLTRSDAILDDIAVLQRLPNAHAGMSIPSVDADVLAHFEPRAAAPSRRLEVLAHLRQAGVQTFAVVQPQLPGPLDALADALAARVSSVSLDVLHGVEAAGAQFDAPGYADARDGAWQRARADAVAAALTARGVEVWAGELPPGLTSTGARALRR